jgi:hypothetical protein
MSSFANTEHLDQVLAYVLVQKNISNINNSKAYKLCIISDDYTEVIDHPHKDVDIVTFNQKVIEDGIEKPIVKLGKDFPINHLCIYRTEFRDELTFGDYGTNEDLCFVDSIGHAKFEISKIAHIDKVLYIYERNTKIKKEYHRHKMFRNSKSMNFSELMRHEDRIFPHNENSWRL